MARTGLWKVKSGAFAGWRDGDQLYDAHGCHAGYFEGDVARSLQGPLRGRDLPRRLDRQEARGGPRTRGASPARWIP